MESIKLTNKYFTIGLKSQLDRGKLLNEGVQEAPASIIDYFFNEASLQIIRSRCYLHIIHPIFQ
jgi:hypothetical protein